MVLNWDCLLELYIEFALIILKNDIVQEQLRGLIVLIFGQHIASLGCRLDIIENSCERNTATPQSPPLSFVKLHIRVGKKKISHPSELDLHFPPSLPCSQVVKIKKKKRHQDKSKADSLPGWLKSQRHSTFKAEPPPDFIPQHVSTCVPRPP